jgi:hypothetical protein
VTAYRLDVEGRELAAFGRDDGTWIAIAALVRRAAAVSASPRRCLQDACRLARSLRSNTAILTGPSLDAPTRRASRIDCDAYLLRSVAEVMEEAGALRLAKCVLDGLANSARAMSPLERGRSRFTYACRCRPSGRTGERGRHSRGVYRLPMPILPRDGCDDSGVTAAASR